MFAHHGVIGADPGAGSILHRRNPANLFGRPLDATEVMSRLKIPVLVTHGDRDRNAKLGTAQYTAKTIPGAKLSVYEGIGHAPFYEDAARFNTELAALVRSANRTN